MFGLLIGILLGILGKVVYDTVRGPERPATLADLQRRATATLEESRQVLQQVHQELGAAAATARGSAERRLGRTGEPASTSEGATAGSSLPSGSESGSAGAVPSSGGSSGGGGASAASSLPGGGTGGAPGSPGAGSSGSSGTRGGSEPGSGFAP